MGSVDWGFDYYAPQVFDDENGRTLIQAWIGSWPFMPWCGGQYHTSELGWYGSITLARVRLFRVRIPVVFQPYVEPARQYWLVCIC